MNLSPDSLAWLWFLSRCLLIVGALALVTVISLTLRRGIERIERWRANVKR